MLWKAQDVKLIRYNKMNENKTSFSYYIIY